jgi:thiamine kinase
MPRDALEELAERCVPGAGPIDIHPLASGLVNTSYRVLRAGRIYSMRVAAANSQDLGLDRQWECQVLKEAASAGLAPVIEYCDPVQGVVVAGWVNGRTWTRDDILQADTIDAVAQLLRRIHTLTPPRPARVMNPAAWITYYAGALARRGLGTPPRMAPLQGALNAHLELLAAVQLPTPVLCHGDLHRLNVVVGERTVLLDWEYAHISDPFWDLAGWIANNDWTEDAAGRLAASYLRRAADSAERTRLEALVWLYDHVCLMWSELYLNQRSGPESHEVSARADRLVMRLKAHQ